MPNARDIRRRIKSVKNIKQITKAMEMVAAARLRRAQERAFASRPYTEKLREVILNIAENTGSAAHRLLRAAGSEASLYLVLSADKGLAGAYNSNIIREAVSKVKGKEYAGLMTVGRKSRDYFRRRGYKLDNQWVGISERPSAEDAAKIADVVATGLKAGTYNRVYVVYTRFLSPMNHVPTTLQLFPLERDGKPLKNQMAAGDGDVWDEASAHVKMPYNPEDKFIIEPSGAAVFDHVVQQYVQGVIYQALLQSAASELGARMTAMGAATSNAEDIISQLILNYNKVRQAVITREISEIVGGVEALQ